jgi:hypothetical protein
MRHKKRAPTGDGFRATPNLIPPGNRFLSPGNKVSKGYDVSRLVHNPGTCLVDLRAE